MSSFNNYEPIYKQLMDRICSDIIRGSRQAGEKLPSVREFAVDVGVNMNTIQRVYQELERIGIVETKRGQGTFVTENINEIDQQRTVMKKQYVKEFIRNMKSMGYTVEEMMESIQEVEESRDDSNR
ncbi:GntR family transcriptional regulator [Virgibacillus soli]|uniref:GntR family transcriptional regulator n=1 Tax=Paracerasibacillus soli TaxID=480284 RepID=A0ABU5CQX1_9BACI|nr:GntR family transcriptional regulator [Virgibacillus soli]MDY0408744.1 GntR family transcriptional regulator [Virgibacillus soli]